MSFSRLAFGLKYRIVMLYMAIRQRIQYWFLPTWKKPKYKRKYTEFKYYRDENGQTYFKEPNPNNPKQIQMRPIYFKYGLIIARAPNATPWPSAQKQNELAGKQATFAEEIFYKSLNLKP